jgi:hypothetical protein
MPTKLLRPNVGIFVAAADAFANWAAPTLAELTAPTKVFNVSPAIADGYTLNMTDSDLDTSLSMTDSAQVSTPTLYNYEASFDGFRDSSTSATSVYNKFRDLFTVAAGTKYYLIKRIGKAHDAAWAVTDTFSIYGVTTDIPVDIVADGAMIMLGARFLTTGEVAVNIVPAAGTAGAGPALAATVGTKMQSNANVAVWWVPNASVSNEATFLATPSATIVNAAVNLTPAIAWDGYELGATDSNKIDDKGIADAANAQARGFAQFAGSLTFFRGITSETTGAYYTAFETFKAATNARVNGYLVTRIGGGTGALASGEKANVFKFTADAVMDNTEGEDSVKFMVNFQPQGLLGVWKTAAA